MVDLEAIASNLARVQERITAAARRAGREPREITLVAVTKTVPLEAIVAAYTLGLRHFGENRVQEALQKVAGRPPGATWHMIGHLQRNKAKAAVRIFDLIHSVDSVPLAQELDRHCRALGKRLPVLLEVNVAGEASKFGFLPEGAFWEAVEQILSLPGLEVQGLMTVAPMVTDPEAVRPVFRQLRELRDELRRRWPALAWPHLSMGMTDDFEVAIEEGATMVRLGRAIFGPRF